MSNFLYPENQLGLWRFLQKYSQIDQYFTNISSQPRQAKEQWFHDCIQTVYSHWMNRRIGGIRTIEDLNQYAIQYIMNDIQMRIEQYEMNRFTIPVQNMPTNSLTVNTPQAQTASNYINDIYQERKREYELINQKKPPPTLDLKYQKDEAISDIQSLVEKEKKEREREIQVIGNSMNDNIIATIMPDNTQSITNIQPISNAQSNNDKKTNTVRWGENVEHEHQHVNIYELKMRIDKIEAILENIMKGERSSPFKCAEGAQPGLSTAQAGANPLPPPSFAPTQPDIIPVPEPTIDDNTIPIPEHTTENI